MAKPGPFAALLAVLPLAACADLADIRHGGPFTTASVPTSLAEEVDPARALASLPAEAGEVVSVTERRERDRLTQVVALGGDAGTRGSNRIRIVAAEPDPSVARRMTEERIDAELATEMPGIDMRPITRMAETSVGPIGIATGRAADGEVCVYAWQETRAGRRFAGASLFAAPGDVDLSVRLRVCRRDLSEERLVTLVERMSLRGDIAPLSGRAVAGSIGVDALATAGYGGRAGSRAVEPLRAGLSAAPRREAASVRVAAPHLAPRAVTAPARPRPAPAAAPERPAPEPAAVAKPQPAIVANPIPLPSGG